MTLNAKWMVMAEKETKGRINIKEKLIKETNEQMLIKPIYTSEDWSPPKEPELSGEFPYKRGHMATMYASRPWTVRQYAGFSTVEESNKFYRANLAAGQ
jgi:methylmalonyl-CoA mutase